MRKMWHSVGGISNIEVIREEAWRIVEDQARSSTRKMVDTVAEHTLLEQIIEDDKPRIKFYGDEHDFSGLHYLLFTPFRYPPLRHGTRFGKKIERNLFYSSLEIETAMCEKAFHRLNFLLASDGNIGDKTVNCTVFKVKINTQKGIDLSKSPFEISRDKISNLISYHETQELGSCMREDGVEVFISYSARSKNNGKNLNVFTPIAFIKNQSIEDTFQHFSCYSTKSTVEFYSNGHLKNKNNNPVVFKADSFYLDGKFPAI